MATLLIEVNEEGKKIHASFKKVGFSVQQTEAQLLLTRLQVLALNNIKRFGENNNYEVTTEVSRAKAKS